MSNELYKYSRIPEPESKSVKVTLIFNRLNGVFLSATNLPLDLCDQDDIHCIYVEDMMDLYDEEVVGGLVIAEDGSYTKDYEIIHRDLMKTKIYESQLDTTVATKITVRYPLVEQVNILGRALKKLAEVSNVELTELEELLDYIKLVKDTNKVYKEIYANSPDIEYISNEEKALQAEIGRAHV